MSHPASGPPPQGTLEETFLPGLLYGLHHRAFTGTVQVRNGPTGKSVFFREGRILSASSNHDDDRLSSLLLRERILSPEQLEMAREKLRPGTSLGRSLVDLGFVSRSQLMETARNQVRGILRSLFDWESGQFLVLENQVPPSVPQLGMETEQLLFDALMGSSNRKAVLKDLGGMDRRLRRTGGTDAGRKGFPSGGEARTVLSLADGNRRVADICAETHLDDFSTAKILSAGLHSGLVEPVPDEEKEPIPTGEGTVEIREPPQGAEGGTIPVRLETPGPGEEEVRKEEGREPPSGTGEESVPPGSLETEPPIPSSEGPFHGYVDTSAGDSKRFPFGFLRGNGGFRPAGWMAIGGLFVAASLSVLAILLWRAGGTEEPASPAPVSTPQAATAAAGGGEIPVRPPRPAQTAREEEARPAPAPPPSPPTRESPLDLARRALLSGEFAAAAEQYRSALAEAPSGSYTLQLLVACRPETIAGILPPPEGFFLLPMRYGGKECFRACWGNFPDRASALKERQNLPGGFSELPDPPYPIPVSRALHHPGSVEASLP